MSVTGVFQAVMSICANPVVYRRYGTRGILRLSNYGLLANLVFQPLLHLVRETWGETLLVTLLPISVVLSWVQMLAFCKGF